MKAGIFDPYLDTVGGGERYCLTFAEALLVKGWEVDIFWPKDKTLKKKLIDKLALGIERVNFLPYSPWKSTLFNRIKRERGYDILFYFSDGSIPLMFGKKNILHFQVPFKKVLNITLKNFLKLKLVDEVICNSFFTKKIIDKHLSVNSKVIYPPVDIEKMKLSKKENIILSVGRFSQLLQSKKQDILVEAFKKMIKIHHLTGWQLILAGGSEVGADKFLVGLRKLARGYPIKIWENLTFSELLSLYGRAKIFWSASGFGVDEEAEPEKVEHFGISTVEAMAAGCAPLVLGKGGQKEIVEPGKNGFLWMDENELIKQTVKLINDDELLRKISRQAVLRSKLFSKMKFYENIYKTVNI